MAAAAQFPDEELLRLGRGVCMIKTKFGKGTGFHYGGGWILSDAHIFQNVKDKKTMNSIISSATFTFKGGMVEDDTNFKKCTEENCVVFGPQDRTAFIHHQTPGLTADIPNNDIAMIKLGKQDEVVSKPQVKSQLTAFAEILPPFPLSWTGDIQEYVGNEGGVLFITAIETYLAQKDFGNKMREQVLQARENRRQEAKANRLPIYNKLYDPHLERIENHIQEAEDNKLKHHDNTVVKPEREGLVKIAKERHLTIYLPNGESY